ncbi:MAG: glycosyltransferase family 1 protein [Actinomycetota bacterium]|nr:glycosyltransferase family 1 protein [Actinomycetota bacterium]
MSDLRAGSAIHVNLLWCAPGRVGGSEEYLVRQLSGLPDEMRCVVHLGRSLAQQRTELARHELAVTRLNVDRRAVRIPVEHSLLATATRRAALVHHGGGTMPLLRPDTPTVLTVHDLQFRRFPEYFSTSRLRYLRALMPRSARAATVVTTPTAHVADDVSDAFGVDRDRIVVVPHGIPPVEASGEDVNRLRRRVMGGGDGRMILFPAITHPHKGHQLLLDAFSRWAEPDDRLVLIGGQGRAEAEVSRAIALHPRCDQIVRLGRVLDADRDALVVAADLVVFPSEEEGFGAPVMEAMAAGTPVVASRIGALIEVIGDAGALVERNPDAVAEAMTMVLSDPMPWVERGRERAARFTLEASGSALAGAYREAMERTAS